MKRIIVRKDSYYDSVVLMSISAEVKKIEGVKEAVVAMGTEMNLDLLQDMGFSGSELESSGPNDLIIALEAEADEALTQAERAVGELLRKKSSGGGESTYRPVDLNSAVKLLPDANLVVISLPGAYAAREARKALLAGLHVMLFSDNVAVEQEVQLKQLAAERGLLMMGPDCGTAMINGMPICFANVVRRGDIGLISAAGTGLQEVACSIERNGGGVSQGIGTGGRDLKNERVGGIMVRMAAEALGEDPETKVIAVVSKPPAQAVIPEVMKTLEATGKPCVVHFIGAEHAGAERARGPEHPGAQGDARHDTIRYAASLEETARMAVALSRGERYEPYVFDWSEDEIDGIVQRESAEIAPDQKYLRGLFAGGTLTDEAVFALHEPLGGVYSLDPVDPEFELADPQRSVGHTIVDLGEDVFTVGRPHPMIDASIRTERIEREAVDPEVAVLLIDCVIGYSSHPDPAGAMLPALRDARERARRRGGYLAVVGSVTGTAGDSQNIDVQRSKLESVGCVVMPSNYQAVKLVERIMARRAG